MRHILFALVILILPIQLNAQWYQVNTNTIENLYDIFFVDSLEGYCVGGSDNWGTPQSTGVILKTTDGGENWSTIFSMDSIMIKNIAIVQENNNTKLYAFALKRGTPYLVSTFLNTPFQNWSVTPINYTPSEVKVYNNRIYYLDENSNELQFIENGLTNSLGGTYLFDVNHHGIFCLKSWADSLYFSPTFDNSFAKINSHTYYSIFGQNQSNQAAIKKNGDTLLLKATYPSAVVYSTNNGSTWSYNYGGGEGKSIILESSIILSLHINSGKILISSNFGQNWNETEIIGEVFNSLSYSKNNIAYYVCGNNGSIYKNLNLVGVNNIRVKKKINIYPNPVKDILQINASETLKIKAIELLNINGQSIKNYKAIERQLNVSNIPSGIYCLRFITEDGSITQKVVIE